jgi:AhpD family alkylhydroperoxidase
MKQTNQHEIKKAQELLEDLREKRGGAILEFHKRMANDPGLLKAFTQMYEACNKEMKHIPRKYRELMIFAIGCARNAPTTVEVHSKLAVEHGATIEELGETLRILFLLCGVSGFHPGLAVFDPL